AASLLPIPIGINIGKNRDTPSERAVEDYVAAIERLAPWASYLVLNVSSPNTAGLRDLQRPVEVEGLVRSAVLAAAPAAATKPPPVLVKFAPDFAPGGLEESVAAALAGGAAGFVAVNTTLSREGVTDDPQAAEAGGLSGRPLFTRALAAVGTL